MESELGVLKSYSTCYCGNPSPLDLLQHIYNNIYICMCIILLHSAVVIGNTGEGERGGNSLGRILIRTVAVRP